MIQEANIGCGLFGLEGSQAAMSMQAAIDCFNDINAWEKQEYCCWFAVRAAEWTQYQYRYAIPTRLVECLVHEPCESKGGLAHGLGFTAELFYFAVVDNLEVVEQSAHEGRLAMVHMSWTQLALNQHGSRPYQ